MTIHRIHEHAPVRGFESSGGGYALQEREVSRWALQWRSIILSSLGKTAYPYCLYIRTLDLSNLDDLLNDSLFRDTIQETFFEGDMRDFMKTLNSVVKTRKSKYRQKLAAAAIIDMVGESISSFAGESAKRNGGSAALEKLAGNISKGALPRWISRLSRLKSMTLWDASILDDSIADIINISCLAFDTLNFFYCRGDDADADLASFFVALRSNTLRALEVISYNSLCEQTFISLSNHQDSLRHLTLGSLTPSDIKALTFLRDCTAIQALQLQGQTGMTDLDVIDRDILLEIVSWITSCKQLKCISLENFANGPEILTSVCLEKAIHLDSLSLSGYLLRENTDFHRALAHQTTLESLRLNADPDESSSEDSEVLVSSICKLKKLKYLNLLNTSEHFKTIEVRILARHLPKVW